MSVREEKKEMSSEEVGTKVQEALDRKAMLEKLDGVEVLKQKVEDLYEQQKKVIDALTQPKQTEAIEGLKKEVEQVRKQQELFCDPKSGQCFVTKIELERFLEEQNKKIPQILGGHQDLNSFFNHLNENPDDSLHKSLDTRVPASLKARLIKRWCQDGECKPLLQEEGITVHDEEESPKRGAYPGSVR